VKKNPMVLEYATDADLLILLCEKRNVLAMLAG